MQEETMVAKSKGNIVIYKIKKKYIQISKWLLDFMGPNCECKLTQIVRNKL